MTELAVALLAVSLLGAPLAAEERYIMENQSWNIQRDIANLYFLSCQLSSWSDTCHCRSPPRLDQLAISSER